MEQVARELVSEGYEVIREPGPHLLPRGLRQFRPNLLAQRAGENLIVEVKLVPDRESTEQVRAMAHAVTTERGWHFRLVTAPRQVSAVPLTLEQASARTAEAEQLIRAGHLEAGLLLLLGAAEAAGRRLAEIEEAPLQRWNSAALLRELVHLGLLDQADFELLENARVRRNGIVHGLSAEPVSRDEVCALAQAVRRLIAEAEGASLPTVAPAAAT